MSKKRLLIPFLFLLVWLTHDNVLAQEQRRVFSGKLNLALQSTLRNGDPDRMIHLFVRGDAAQLESAARNAGGNVKSAMHGLVSLALPASAIEEFAAHPAVEFIEYRNSKPQVLNDMMILNNNVAPVHAGVTPLPQAYLGEDVILGFIDTGIELDHPDFQTETGSTRVIALWDQTMEETDPFRVPQPYGYGQEYTAEDIDGNVDSHDDQAAYFGHGSTVAGVAAGNAGASGNLVGVAPKTDIVVVASDLEAENWPSIMADAVDFIFARAEAVGKPAVINISLGDYFGSHDALDGASLFVDSLLDEQPGRVVVAAVGNSRNFAPYHLAYDVPETDTAFTWMRYHPNSLLGEGAVFFELWADSAQFAQTSYAMGADLSVPGYEFHGYSAWRNAVENQDTILTDTLFRNDNILGIIDTWCGKRGDQYQIQVAVRQPFSSQYRWRFATTGGGRFDVWSYGPFGTSVIELFNVPDQWEYPPMSEYRFPDGHSTLVDGFACSDRVITVGNYTNRDEFPNFAGGISEHPDEPGKISINSSSGPTRDLRQKPDVSASGDVTLSAGRLATLNTFISSSPNRVHEDGWHYVNGGSSIAAPVVAGIAALYLSRDPDANWQEVKSAIVDNALADPFTGELPNWLYGHGKVDAFAALTVPFVTSVTHVDPVHIPVFPNPTTGVLYIPSRNEGTTAIEIYDASGRLGKSMTHPTAHEGVLQIDAGGFPPGIYLLRTTHGDGSMGYARFAVGN